MPDWTQPPLSPAPGDLGPVLSGATLLTVENDRAARSVRLRFGLPPDAGTAEATFAIAAATHLLSFAYLPPLAPLPEGDALAAAGDWARQGLVVSTDPLAFGTPLTVARAVLHVVEDGATLAVEGYGEDSDALVWWEVRASGARVESG